MLTNPAVAAQILKGYEAINQNGNKMTGTYEPLVLPALDAPAEVDQILEGYQAINRKGLVVTGTMEDNSGRWFSAAVDLETGTVNVPRGFHDGITGVQIEVEEKVVTPSDKKQEIVPSGGAVLGKVIVEPAESGGGEDFEITDASYLFYEGARLSSIEKFLARVKNCTKMNNMFHFCSFAYDLDLSSLDTGKVTDMRYMFHSCNNLRTLNISNFDTANVTNMSYMFGNCGRNVSSFKTLDLSHFDTSKVTSMQSMFDGANTLETIVVDNFNTANVTNTGSMFSGCNALKSLNLSNWDTGKITNMGNMFYLCYALENIVGFSATNKAGLTIGFPYGTASKPCALRRLTFRTDLPDGTYAVRSAIKIPYCSFWRDGMVEMFNTLPDVSGLGLSTSNTTITITSNPCVLDTVLLKEKSGIAVGSYAEFIVAADEFYGACDRTGATMKGFVDGVGWESVNVTDVTEETFNYTQVSFLDFTATVPEEGKLSEADKLIATNKGWTLVT